MCSRSLPGNCLSGDSNVFLPDCPDNPRSHACRFGAFGDYAVHRMAYYVDLYRQSRARIAVNFRLYAGHVGTDGNVLALAIDYVAAIGMVLKDSHQ